MGTYPLVSPLIHWPPSALRPFLHAGHPAHSQGIPPHPPGDPGVKGQSVHKQKVKTYWVYATWKFGITWILDMIFLKRILVMWSDLKNLIGQRSHDRTRETWLVKGHMDCWYLVGKGGPYLCQHVINIIWSKGFTVEELRLVGVTGTLLASLGVGGI